MKIPGRKDAKENIFELVVRWLQDETHGQWLLVLDNLDDDAVLATPQAAASSAQSGNGDGQLQRSLSAYIPQCENGTILITTRTRNVATKLVEPRDIIPVEPMTNTDAIVLLQKKLDGIANEHDLKELASILEYMPLAIVQAAAYIQQKGVGYSVQQYIKAFQKNEKQKASLLNYEAGHLRRDSEAKNSIIITWQISFDDIRGKWPLSADLLSLMSYFDRQGIPKEVLTIQSQGEEMWDLMRQGDNGDRDNRKDEDGGIEDDGVSEVNVDDSDVDVFDEAMDRLRNYSFVSIREDRRTFEMHGLVQLATRKWLEMHGDDERWRARFFGKLNALIPNGDYENWGLCEILFPHAKSAEKQRPVRNRSVQEWAQILRKAAWYALDRGNYGEAERMCEKSAGALRKVLGGDNVETLYSLALLASTYWSQGRWTEAEEMDVQVMEISKRVLGEEHPSTLNSIANLATTYRNQGRWTEAEEMEVQVMEIRKRVLGEEHPHTLTAMNNLAFTIKEQGRKLEAIRLLAECVQLLNRVLGTEHPDALSSAAALAAWENEKEFQHE